MRRAFFEIGVGIDSPGREAPGSSFWSNVVALVGGERVEFCDLFNGLRGAEVVREVRARRDGRYIDCDVVADGEKADGVVVFQGVTDEYGMLGVGAVVATAHGSGFLGALQQETQNGFARWREQFADGADNVTGDAAFRVDEHAHVRTLLIEISGVTPGTGPRILSVVS